MRTIYPCAWLLTIGCAASSSHAVGQPSSTDPTPQELLNEVRALRDEVRELRAKVAESQSTAATRESDVQETIDRVRRDVAFIFQEQRLLPRLYLLARLVAERREDGARSDKDERRAQPPAAFERGRRCKVRAHGAHDSLRAWTPISR